MSTIGEAICNFLIDDEYMHPLIGLLLIIGFYVGNLFAYGIRNEILFWAIQSIVIFISLSVICFLFKAGLS